MPLVLIFFFSQSSAVYLSDINFHFSIANHSALGPEAVSRWSITLIVSYSWIILISKDAKGYLGLESKTVFTVSILCKYCMNFYCYKTPLLKETRHETFFSNNLFYWQILGKRNFVNNTNFTLLRSYFYHQSLLIPLFLIFHLWNSPELMPFPGTMLHTGLLKLELSGEREKKTT